MAGWDRVGAGVAQCGPGWQVGPRVARWDRVGAGVARCGPEWQGAARSGTVRPGMARCCLEWGLEWHSAARDGTVYLGVAGWDRVGAGVARCGPEWHFGVG